MHCVPPGSVKKPPPLKVIPSAEPRHPMKLVNMVPSVANWPESFHAPTTPFGVTAWFVSLCVVLLFLVALALSGAFICRSCASMADASKQAINAKEKNIIAFLQPERGAGNKPGEIAPVDVLTSRLFAGNTKISFRV